MTEFCSIFGMVKFGVVQLAEICLAVYIGGSRLVLVDSPWVHVFLVGIARFWMSYAALAWLYIGLGVATANHSGWGWLSIDPFWVLEGGVPVGLPLRMRLALRPVHRCHYKIFIILAPVPVSAVAFLSRWVGLKVPYVYCIEYKF